MRNVRIRRSDLVWDQKNVAHFGKHTVTKYEIEQILKGAVVVRETYGDRLMMVGKFKRRMISVVVTKVKEGYLVITARDSSKNERKIFRNEK